MRNLTSRKFSGLAKTPHLVSGGSGLNSVMLSKQIRDVFSSLVKKSEGRHFAGLFKCSKMPPGPQSSDLSSLILWRTGSGTLLLVTSRPYRGRSGLDVTFRLMGKGKATPTYSVIPPPPAPILVKKAKAFLETRRTLTSTAPHCKAGWETRERGCCGWLRRNII